MATGTDATGVPGGSARGRGAPAATIALLLLAGLAILNALSYALLAANPLPRSDNWRALNGYLGRFIERGFSWLDLFAQSDPGDTNFPLNKAVTLWHTRYWQMDFGVESVVGTFAAIGIVAVIAQCALRLRPTPLSAATLLAWLAMVVLSINSSELYNWPLAAMWFMPLLLACIYIRLPPSASMPVVVAATALLGLLLDEFAYPVVASLLIATWLVPAATPGPRVGRFAAAAVAGLLVARMSYAAINAFAPQEVLLAPPTTRSITALASAEAWKAAAWPLADSLLHVDHARRLAGAQAVWLQVVIAAGLGLAHLGFWWRIVQRRAQAHAGPVVRMAAAIMLLFYATALGIVMQRVPAFGYDYLHQPRYVAFYQLNLAALGIMGWIEASECSGKLRRSLVPVAAAALIAMCALQWHVAGQAWDDYGRGYGSRYLQSMAGQMGQLARDPDAAIKCVPLLTVCGFPEAPRRRVIGLLAGHGLSVFSPQFQARHRLVPAPVRDDGR